MRGKLLAGQAVEPMRFCAMPREARWIPLPDLKRRLIAAVCALYRYDSDLIDVDANERSLTHKLAEHLKGVFPGWHVDCEYNRSGYNPKLVNFGLKSRPED